MGRLLSALVILSALSLPALAQAPESGANNSPDPGANNKPGWMDYNPYNGEQTNLANPHRTGEEVLAWAEKAAANALTLSPDRINAQIVEVKKTFNPTGWNQYASYVRDMKIIETVRDQRYAMTTVLIGDAVVINSGAVEGAYRWLVQAPLMITFLRTNVATGEQEAAGGGNFNLIMQIGRENTAGPDGMAIESWKISRAEN